MIQITSKKEGFRRAGIVHSKEPTDYQDDEFSKEELAILTAEPMLVVQEGDVDDRSPEERLQDAIAGLDIMDGTLWTDSGKPQVKTLEAVLNRQITAADRDAAWKVYQENKD